jgi:hypothetical protein
VRLVVIAWSVVSPRAFAHDEVVAVLGPRASEDASLVFGEVIADAGRPLGLPWADHCLLDILGGLASPRGWLPPSDPMWFRAEEAHAFWCLSPRGVMTSRLSCLYFWVWLQLLMKS